MYASYFISNMQDVGKRKGGEQEHYIYIALLLTKH